MWRRESRLALGLALGPRSSSVCFCRGRKARARARAGSLRQQQEASRLAPRPALLSLYALDSRLARARSELAGLHGRVEALRAERQQVRQEIEVVAGNLAASQRLLATA